MALTDNLVGWWELGEASGTRSDSHGTQHLTPQGSPGNAAGKVGNAVALVRSSTQYLTRASEAALQTGNVSWTGCAWCKLSATAPQANHVILSKYDGGSFDGEFEIRADTQFGVTQVYAILYSPSGNKIANTPNGAFSLDTWFFVVGWHDATADTINVQVNDGTIYSTATSGNFSSTLTGPFQIGAVAGTSTFDGLIDQAGYWVGRALDAGERSTLYNSGNGVAYADITGGGGGGTKAPPLIIRPHRFWRR